MAKQTGLTLIEMLVSLFILTIVMSLSSNAYRYYVISFNERGDKLQQTTSQLIAKRLVQQQLESAFYYYVKIDPINSRPYFLGTEQALSWIASGGIKSPGVSTLAWLGTVDNKLLYCERPVTEPLLVNLPENTSDLCEHFSLPLFEVESISVRYYGWQNPLDQFNPDPEYVAGGVLPTPAWDNQFNSVQRQVLPLYVVLTLQQPDSENTEWWFAINNVDVVRLGIFDDQSSG